MPKFTTLFWPLSNFQNDRRVLKLHHKPCIFTLISKIVKWLFYDHVFHVITFLDALREFERKQAIKREQKRFLQMFPLFNFYLFRRN